MTLDQLMANLSVEVEPFAICYLAPGWRLRLPPPPVPMLHFVLRGNGAVGMLAGRSVSISPSWMAVVPPGVDHLLQSDGPIENELKIEPPPDGAPVCRLLGGSPDDASFVVACGLVVVRYGPDLRLFEHLKNLLAADLSGAPQVRAAFEAILAEQAGLEPGSVVMTRALMTQCLVAFFRRVESSGSLPWLEALDDPRLGPAIDRILEDPSAHHTVEALAGVSSMSRSVFAERFVAAFGQTPMAMVHHVRMQYAARLLRSDRTLSIDGVAARAGYSSRSHFSAAFRKHHGVSPADFRAGGGAAPIP